MRMIDADALKIRMLDYYQYSQQLCEEISDFFDNTPTIEPDLDEAYAHGETEAEARFHQRKKGCWIEHNPHKWGLGIVFECSECGEKIDCEPSNYCPNCGADMRTEDNR